MAEEQSCQPKVNTPLFGCLLKFQGKTYQMAPNESNVGALLEATAKQGYQMALNMLHLAAMPSTTTQPRVKTGEGCLG